MKGFVRAVLASALLAHISAAFAQAQLQDSIIAEYVDHKFSVVSPDGYSIDQKVFRFPGSSFIKLHFSDFRLPPGMIVEVRNPDGTESYSYSREVRDGFTFDAELGDDGVTSFYAMSISGDTAVVEVHGKPGFSKSVQKSARGRVFIDHAIRGFESDVSKPQDEAVVSGKSGKGASLQSLGSGNAVVESTCGSLERYDAVCYAGSDPAAYDRSRPVAKIVVGLKSCTAWRVGSDNHMFTNNHCAASQSETSAMEVWFNYERTVCGGDTTESIVKVSGDKLISTDYTLDYTLFSVTDFAAIEPFGNLGLEVREALLGEVIYIPQHGSGDPKQLAIESDLNAGGLCQVDDPDYTGRAAGTDIGYFCDTIGGSSGSPVVLEGSHKAIALHHSGGCFNSGVKMSEIWSKVARHFGRVVPEGDFDPASIDPPSEPEPDAPPVAAIGYVCTNLDCSFDGGGSSDAEGALVAYSWNFGDGASASGMTAAHSYSSEGSYSVTLTVTDAAGNTGTAARTVTVVAPSIENSPPTAEFAFVCSDRACSFDASASSDSDGDVVAYSWSFGDGFGGTGRVADHVFGLDGSYVVTLTVQDDRGATAQASRTVTVQAAAPAPMSIELTAVGVKEKGQKRVDLDWRGSEASTVRIYRDSVELVVLENTGSYSDTSVDKRAKSAAYKVCDTSGSVCSNEVEVLF